MILRSTQCLHTFSFVGRGLVDMPGHRGRSDETHRRNPGVCENPIDRRLVALDHVEDAVGKTGLGDEFREEDRRRRILLRRL